MRKLLVAAALLGSASMPAAAGGFYLQEQSPTGVGRAFAGEAALAREASTVFHNPAGMTQLGRGAIDVGTHMLFLDSSQSDRGSTRRLPNGATVPTGGGNGGKPFEDVVLVPSGYGAFRLGQSDVWLGLGVSAPFGLKVVYDKDWFGRYDSIRSDLKTLNLQPSIAYALSDTISIGAGLDVQTIKAELTNALPNLLPAQPDGMLKLKGKDTSFGWNAGILFNLPNFRAGAHYRSSVEHNLAGSLVISGLLGPLSARNGSSSVTAPIATPDIATVSLVYGTQSPVRLLASANWYNWSKFDAISVRSDGRTISDSPQNYKDTWSVSAGGELDLSPSLTVRGGVMHDRTPTRDNYRTTRVPDGDRSWLTTGATYRLNEAFAINLSYAHVFVSSEHIDRTDQLFAGTPAATTVDTQSRNSGNVDMVAASVSVRF